ncbi:hypothetical protein IKE87_01480, partial [Candidatus Saccharibacteria bacterium]|nr:hypothetical protein [Candidatus Saccharibacteria bacterium]
TPYYNAYSAPEARAVMILLGDKRLVQPAELPDQINNLLTLNYNAYSAPEARAVMILLGDKRLVQPAELPDQT